MEQDEILDVIQDIMIQDGPDGHTDGSDIIVDFILALKNGKEYEWFDNYKERIIKRTDYKKKIIKRNEIRGINQ